MSGAKCGVHVDGKGNTGATISNNTFVNHEHAELGYAEYSKLYASNQLTLCQAVHGMQSQVVLAGNSSPKVKELLEFLGHKLAEEDNIAIELGFENFEDWWAAGRRPVGWYQLFTDNYEQYKEKS